jgi:hypothetical protein
MTAIVPHQLARQLSETFEAAIIMMTDVLDVFTAALCNLKAVTRG